MLNCVTDRCAGREMVLVQTQSSWTVQTHWCPGCGRVTVVKTFVGRLSELAPLVIAGTAVAGLLGGLAHAAGGDVFDDHYGGGGADDV